jgi:hypothetical protein
MDATAAGVGTLESSQGVATVELTLTEVCMGVGAMSRLVSRATVVLLAGVLVASCGSTPTETPKGTELPGPETQALATTLQREGASVALAEVMPSSSHPYFSTPAARYVVNGESLYFFEYATDGNAEAEASRIAPDGASVGMSQVSWVSDPHFYRSGPVVALYVGRQPSMLGLLQKVLGQQIAGK